MSTYIPLRPIHHKANSSYSRPSTKRALCRESSQKGMEFLRDESLSTQNRVGTAIMRSAPTKISNQPMLHSNMVGHYVKVQEQTIWGYLLRPGTFFFMWLLLGLLVISVVVA